MEGFSTALEGINIFYLLLGTAFGLLVGALPGLGPLFGVALMLPLTFGMPAATAIIFLTSIHAATAYGDSIASILINTPGGVGSVAACWDGYPMAKSGRAGVALGISTMGSFFGGLIGWLTLVLISPLLTAFAIKIGAAEYFMLALMALSLLSIASRGQTVKGLILGGLGLLMAFVGQDYVQGVDYRYTFGSVFLEDGLPLVPVTVGLFALSQAIVLSGEGGAIAEMITVSGGVMEGVKVALRRPLTVIRGGVIGILLGIMPALGLSSASVIAYLMEMRASREAGTFGTGNPAGLLAPETAKNACVVGDMIPTFTLGIPGSATTAVLLAALTIHGLDPGPRFFTAGSLPYAVFCGILLAQFSFFIAGIFLARYFARVVYIPNAILVPSIVVLSFIGSYAMRNRMEDVFITIVFGVLGYALNRLRYPSVCLVLGLVLGKMVESNFHRAVKVGDGSYYVFFSRPISLALLIITVIFMLWPYLPGLAGKLFKTDSFQ